MSAPLVRAWHYKGGPRFTGEFIDHPHHVAGNGVIGHRFRHHRCIVVQPLCRVALNAHMAQGLTSDRGIAVMDSRERNLSNQQTFLVTITRLRDGLTLFVDNAVRLEAAVDRNPGMKRSALETVDLLRDAAARGQAKGRAPLPEREQPERDRSLTKPFEIGI